MSEKCNRELGDFYFSVLLKWQTWVISKNLQEPIKFQALHFLPINFIIVIFSTNHSFSYFHFPKERENIGLQFWSTTEDYNGGKIDQTR